MANIVTTEVITEALNGRSVLLSDKLSSDYTTMTEDQILNGTGVAAMVSDIKNNRAFGEGASDTATGFAGGKNATAASGGALGELANGGYGGAVGFSAVASAGGGAVGARSGATSGGAVGANAHADQGGAMGLGAIAWQGGAIGANAKTSKGAAVGDGAKCVSGNNPIDAIQLGTGTNSTAGTMQVYSTPLLISDGNGGLVIPPALLIASVGAMTAQEKTDFKAALGIS